MSNNESLSQLAVENFQQGDYETALAQATAVVSESVNDAMMWQIRGLACLQLGEFKDGLEALEKTLALCGDDAQLLNNIGIAKRRLGDLDGAIESYSKSIKLSPDLAATHNNLADALVAQNLWEEALASFRTALMNAPKDVSTRFNYANLLRDMGGHRQACSQYENLMEQFPDDSEIKWNAALAFLGGGDWTRGFDCYESRFDLSHVKLPPVPENIPRWSGEPLDGKCILILSEQGFGDLFQMLACASRMKQRGARVVVQCHPRLHRLLRASPVVDEVSDESGQFNAADCYEWLMSCPGKLYLRAGDVPAAQPWLRAPTQGDDLWKESLSGKRGLKIGLNFQGSPAFPHDAFRSLDVRHFLPLMEREDITVFSLQKGYGEDQLDKLPKDALIPLGHLLDTGDDAFVDTARCIEALDILITSDTAIAHLAGAMGCRVWVVLSTVVDWRWGSEGQTCSWYPSMRLFRQRTRGDWDSVIIDLMQSLDKELASERA